MALTGYKKRAVSVAPENSSIREINCKGNIPQNASKDQRCRWWAIEVYPESALPDWQSKLVGMQWICSPLHDKDVNPDNTPKKPHWHIAVYFPNKATMNEVQELTRLLYQPDKAVKYVERIKNIQGMVRYFAHLDNPEKHQYAPSDIKGFGGVDVAKYLVTATDVDMLLMDIETYCRKNNVTEYGDLCNYSVDHHEELPEWHKCITTHTIHLRAYLASQRCKPTASPDSTDLSDEALRSPEGDEAR